MGFAQLFLDRVLGLSFLAHNAKGWDAYLVVSQLHRLRLYVQFITHGGEFVYVSLTLNFLPMKLSSLPQALCTEGCKGYLSHYFNTAKTKGFVFASHITGIL